KGATVWIRTNGNSFKNKMVEVGMESGERIEIKSGLNAGDVVVISGAYLLHSEYIFKKGANPMEGMKM
ncbi:MAG: efflux RND transporter periplasmic adaptor subunit, partial [Ferruginibacter sp.]